MDNPSILSHVSIAATPSIAAIISSQSPSMMPASEAKPPRGPPLPVEVRTANVPGPGSARNTSTARQNAQ